LQVCGGILQSQTGKRTKKLDPREKETYAIVAALRKWEGWIGFQPVVVKTDHRSLEHWVTENVDTPSGPTGRRARWHVVLPFYLYRRVKPPLQARERPWKRTSRRALLAIGDYLLFGIKK
jgi:hypothetical protein